MLSIDSIQQAARIIQSRVIRTPLIHSSTLSRMFHSNIHLKLENLQATGSFKVRGAIHKIFKCLDSIAPKGVVAASAGNHAQGVALAARQAGVSATIVMPEGASISKQEATRGYGGELIIAGRDVSESLAKAKALAEEGRTFIHPFDDPDIMAGQGVIALELFEKLNDIDIIIVPVGGGGLISGIAAAAKQIRPQVKIIGVQTQACPGAFDAWHQGAVTVAANVKPSLADGINVKQIGKHSFDIIRQYVDDIVLVDEDQIAAAVLLLLERKKILAEGAGAVPLAALLSGAVHTPHQSNVVLIISGGNVDSPLLGRIVNKGLVTKGRFMRLKVYLRDAPGSLAQLLQCVARLNANVLHIYHHRYEKHTPLDVSCVELELETRNADHIDRIKAMLNQQGYHAKVI